MDKNDRETDQRREKVMGIINGKRLLALATLAIAVSLPTASFALQAPPPPGAKVTVYQHCDFGGYRVNLAPGNYDLSDLNARGIRNDDISSIRVAPGYQIIAYQHHRFGGRSIKLRSSDRCLVNNGFNDTISSIRIKRIKPARASVYQHCNYKGYRVSLPPGRYTLNDLTRMGIRNDDLSSIKVPKGYVLFAYAHNNYAGRRLTLRGNDSCLVNNNFNDIISSIIFRKR